MARRRPGAGLLVLAGAAGLLAAEPARAARLDFLHVRANVGGSSGGHAAIRFGEVVYDFQREDGLLRLRRDESRHFQHRYRTLENRPIELLRVEVEAATFERLRRTFARRQIAQDRQLGLAEALRADVDLLEALRAARAGDADAASRFPVDGAGFFAPAPGSGTGAVAALRTRIGAEHGPGFLAARRRALELAIASLALDPVDADAIALEPGRVPVGIDTFSSRYADLAAGLAALDVLERGGALRPERLARAADGERALELGRRELERLREASEALEQAMARLVASPRPDWGHPLLLGMARLDALERSREVRQLVLLDVFPPDATRLPVRGARRDWLPALEAEAQGDLERARDAFLGGAGFEEADFGALEEAAGRWLELRAAGAGAPTLRVAAGRLVPAGRGPLAALPLPAAAERGIEGRLEAARASARRLRARLEAHLGYDLVRRNCVSEIFRTVAEGLGGEPSLESTGRLGGWIEPGAGLGFVPFVAARRVRERWSVVGTAHLPSYREHRLAEMAAREPDWIVALRESNVLTARSYRRNERDGFFLFFTQDGAALRPLLGALNLGAALGRSGVGLLALPVDGGRGLRAGLRGALWSLPELFFANVRKGTNDYVPPAERPPPA